MIRFVLLSALLTLISACSDLSDEAEIQRLQKRYKTEPLWHLQGEGNPQVKAECLSYYISLYSSDQGRVLSAIPNEHAWVHWKDRNSNEYALIEFLGDKDGNYRMVHYEPKSPSSLYKFKAGEDSESHKITLKARFGICSGLPAGLTVEQFRSVSESIENDSEE